MLSNLSEQIAYCYRRAGECKELATLATSPADKDFYLEREQGWLLLARSYEFSDRAGLFINEVQHMRKRDRSHTAICPACAAPTQVCSMMLVCTNCQRVVEDR
jgi:hypothetical protein